MSLIQRKCQHPMQTIVRAHKCTIEIRELPVLARTNPTTHAEALIRDAALTAAYKSILLFDVSAPIMDRYYAIVSYEFKTGRLIK